VTITGVEVVTALVWTGTVALDRPKGTVTVAGTGNAVALLDSVTTAPPGGACPVSVTVKDVVAPPGTLGGNTATENNVGRTAGATVTFAVLLTELYVAVTVTGVEAVTVVVCTTTLAVDRPSWTVRLAGTGNTVALLVSVTEAPPEGAGPLSVTVTIAKAPPAMLVGSTVTAVSVGSTAGATVTFAVLLTELYVAVTVTGVETVTVVVCTITLAVDRPWRTVRLAGTGNTALLLPSVTATSPAGAGPLRVTVRIAKPPPAMVEGSTVTPVSVGRTMGATVTVAIMLVEL